MILEEILLHNFRVYKDRQRIRLEPGNAKRPIILIGGLNGGGKTSLLMALQLALFGRASNVWRNKAPTYDEFLRTSIHRSVAPEDGAGIELQFRHITDGEEHTIRILRYWRAGGRSMQETLEVLRDGELDRVLSDHWSEWVEDFVPPRISPLFFFDGEQIEELADPDQSLHILSTAIQSLLGLDLVDQLATDLKVFERRKRKETADKSSVVDFEALEQERERSGREVEKRTQACAALASEISHLEKKYEDLETELDQHGGTIYAQATELRKELSTIRQQKQTLEEEVREQAAGCLPFLLCSEPMGEFRAQADRESTTQFSGPVLDVLRERDTALLAAASEEGLNRKSVSFLQSFLESDLEARSSQTGGTLLDLTVEGTHRLRHLLDAELPATQRTVTQLLTKIRECELSIEDIDRKLAGLPDEETVKPLLEKQQDIDKTLTRSRAQLHVLEDELEASRRRLTQKEEDLEKAKRADEDLLHEKEDDERLLVHSQRARRTLDSFREKVLQHHIDRIEHLVLESFQRLLRKKRMVRDLRIDPATYRIEIHDEQHGLVQPESLSAGERQLLATSLLWGLSRASGRRLPVVIDTPLGRLDNSHRGNLIERYFPHASHQVILLSTDEEIDDEFVERIEPWVGLEYTLEFDDEQQATVPSEGYFWSN